MCYFKDFVVNIPSDNMGNTLGIGKQYINDRCQSNGSSKKNSKV